MTLVSSSSSLTPDEAWKQTEQSVSSDVLTNVGEAPSSDPSMVDLQPQYFKCSTCYLQQPIKIGCIRCGCKRPFRCFKNFCFKRNQWENFWCRYCHPVEKVNKIPDPPSDSIDLSMDWLQQEKVQLFLAKTKMFTENRRLISEPLPSRTQFVCFHCHKPEMMKSGTKRSRWESDAIDWKNNRMDDEWFCNGCKDKYSIVKEYLENYCYLCRSPMPIAKNCKKCKRFYTFRCIYPPKCITTEFPFYLGTDRWDHCPQCLRKQEYEIVNAKECDEAESEYRHQRILRTLDQLSDREERVCFDTINRDKCCRFLSVFGPLNVLTCVGLLIVVGVLCLYFL